MRKQKLRPRKGIKVVNPLTRVPLPEDGQEVDLDGPFGRYWRRRLRDGDVFTEEPAAPVAKKPARRSPPSSS